eukprot:7132668-Heterocapsa_arctica.AAC.1
MGLAHFIPIEGSQRLYQRSSSEDEDSAMSVVAVHPYVVGHALVQTNSSMQLPRWNSKCV